MLQLQPFVGRLLHSLTSTVLALWCIKLKYNAHRLAKERAAGAAGGGFTTSKVATARYGDYFNNRDTSDVKVVIEVAQSAINLARRQLQVQGNTHQSTNSGGLCAHSLVLMGNSPVWKAQLERWQGGRQQKTITMIIEEGEQAAAHRLVQCLYTDCLPDIETDVDLRMTLGILMLADQYQVTAALALCAQKLDMLTDLGAISWELADSVMRLSAGSLENPGLSCLVVKVQEKILQHVAAKPSHPGIGLDLEVVMRNSTLEKALMALPLRKCASLLNDDRCRVASENTVAAAVVQRVEHEGSRSGEGDAEHVQSAELHSQIMGHVIRVPHLSPLFAVAMPTFASQLTTVMRPEIYALGRELHGLTAEWRGRITKNPSIPRCWLSTCRPTSTVTALEFDWEASTAELAEKFDSGARVLARSPSHFFAGMDWDVFLKTKPSRDNENRTVGLYICGHYPLLKGGPRWGARTNATVLLPDKNSSLHRDGHSSNSAGTGCGWQNFFPILPMQNWDQSRMQKWTSSNGLLTVRVKISDVV